MLVEELILNLVITLREISILLDKVLNLIKKQIGAETDTY